MSDRTPSSVRTGSLSGDASAPKDGAGEPPVSATQSIPTTGSTRAQTGAAGAVPVIPQPLTSAGKPSGPSSTSGAASTPGAASPAGGTAPAAPAPPATGTAASAASATAAPAATVAAAPAAAGTGTGAPDSSSSRGGRGRGSGKAGRGPRRARLQLRHIDIWSAFKISFVLSIALFFIWMVAVGVLYGVLGALGVFDTLNDLFGQLGSASGSDVAGDVVTPGVVFGGAAVIGAVNIVLLTALCTVATFIYNLCSDLVGGLELTLSERD
jgi:hypothetical protein